MSFWKHNWLVRVWSVWRCRGEEGFTLVEVLMAITVVVLVLTAIVSGVSFSVKNTRVSKERAEAVRRAQEAIEWIRSERNADGFKTVYDAIAADGNHVDYCLASLPTGASGLEGLVGGHCGTSDQIDAGNLTREMHVDLSPGLIEVAVQVSWNEGSTTQVSTLRTQIKDWE